MKEIIVSIGRQVTVTDFVSKFNEDNNLTGGAPFIVIHAGREEIVGFRW